MLIIFTPTWIDPVTGRDAIRREVRAAIELQVIDRPWTWVIGRENPYPIGDYRNVLHQYQRAREMALSTTALTPALTPDPSPTGEGRYEALLTIEHDNLLPDTDAVQRMLDTPGDVIYAPYLLRHGSKMLSTWQYINDRNLGMSLSNYKVELRQARDAGMHRVSGTGFGCTLMRRHVLEAIEFTGATARDQNQCPDLRFAAACLQHKFISNGRFDVPVLHWDEERGEWLHPYQTRRNRMAQYRALETKSAFAAGRIVRLERGKPIDLTDEEALDLQRLGAIEAAAAAPVMTEDEAAERLESDLRRAAEAADEQAVEVIEETAHSTPPPSRRKREKTAR